LREVLAGLRGSGRADPGVRQSAGKGRGPGSAGSGARMPGKRRCRGVGGGGSECGRWILECGRWWGGARRMSPPIGSTTFCRGEPSNPRQARQSKVKAPAVENHARVQVGPVARTALMASSNHRNLLHLGRGCSSGLISHIPHAWQSPIARPELERRSNVQCASLRGPDQTCTLARMDGRRAPPPDTRLTRRSAVGNATHHIGSEPRRASLLWPRCSWSGSSCPGRSERPYLWGMRGVGVR
jgi:hypothetical protein